MQMDSSVEATVGAAICNLMNWMECLLMKLQSMHSCELSVFSANTKVRDNFEGTERVPLDNHNETELVILDSTYIRKSSSLHNCHISDFWMWHFECNKTTFRTPLIKKQKSNRQIYKQNSWIENFIRTQCLLYTVMCNVANAQVVITNGPTDMTVCIGNNISIPCGFTGNDPNIVIPDWKIIKMNNSVVISDETVNGPDIRNRTDGLQWIPDFTSGMNNATNSRLVVGAVDGQYDQISFQCVFKFLSRDILSNVGIITVHGLPMFTTSAINIQLVSFTIKVMFMEQSCGPVTGYISISPDVNMTLEDSQNYTFTGLVNGTTYTVLINASNRIGTYTDTLIVKTLEHEELSSMSPSPTEQSENQKDNQSSNSLPAVIGAVVAIVMIIIVMVVVISLVMYRSHRNKKQRIAHRQISDESSASTSDEKKRAEENHYIIAATNPTGTITENPREPETLSATGSISSPDASANVQATSNTDGAAANSLGATESAPDESDAATSQNQAEPVDGQRPKVIYADVQIGQIRPDHISKNDDKVAYGMVAGEMPAAPPVPPRENRADD